MLFPGINDTRGKHKGSFAPGAGRGVRWSLVVGSCTWRSSCAHSAILRG